MYRFKKVPENDIAVQRVGVAHLVAAAVAQIIRAVVVEFRRWSDDGFYRFGADKVCDGNDIPDHSAVVAKGKHFFVSMGVKVFADFA